MPSSAAASSPVEISSLKSALFRFFNRASRVQVHLWTWVYRPFLGHLGRGARLERVSLLTNPERVFLGDKAAICHGARIEAFAHHREYRYDASIHIGNNTSIQPYAHLAAAAKMVIGHDVLMGSHVFITDHDHSFADLHTPIGDQPLIVSPVCIEDFVWLGENVVVLKGVTVGHHAIVGANSVVTHDLPPYAIAVGSPARVLRLRTEADPH